LKPRKIFESLTSRTFKNFSEFQVIAKHYCLTSVQQTKALLSKAFVWFWAAAQNQL